jgi:hypothetical protein
VGGGQNNLAQSQISFIGGGANNVAAEKVRRANSIAFSTSSITVFSATAADFDNTTTNAVQIRYFYNGTWNLITRTISSASQFGSQVNLTLTSNVGANGQTWSEVSVVNTAETDTVVGQVINGNNNNASGNYSTVGGGLSNTASNTYSTVGGGQSNTASGNRSTVGGGFSNTASSIYSTVGGGFSNTASGLRSTVGGGRNNTASNTYSTVGGGFSNTSSGNRSTVGGGFSNTASGQYSIVGGGALNTATGSNSTVGGGIGNNAASYSSTVGGGQSNTASNTYSTVGGGLSNASSGTRSTVSGGQNNTASGTYSCVLGGARAVSSKHGEVSHAAGRFGSDGDAQHSILVARRETTNATANQVLFLNGSSERLTIPAETTWTFSIKLSAYNDTDNQGGWWIFRGGIRRNQSNGTALVGSIITENGVESTLSAASASVVADDTNEALEIRVTGVASKTIRWVAVVDISQVSSSAVSSTLSGLGLAGMAVLTAEIIP